MKITVIGTGAMACLFAGYLSPWAEVGMVGSWAEQIAAIRSQGLQLIEPNGRLSTHFLPVTNNPAEVAPADLALVLVKSYQSEKAAVLAQQVLHQQGIVLSLQNGWGNVEKISAVLGPGRTALGSTTQGAQIAEPGRVLHTGYGKTHLANPGTSTDNNPFSMIHHLAGLLRQAGMEVYEVEQVDSLLWGKLAVNAGINPLTALLQVRNGFLAENEQARQMMQAVAEEVAAVAQAQGIRLPYPDVAAQVLAVAQATAVNESSMLQDIQRGAPTEIEAICGAVVKYGRLFHVPTPLNEKLLELVKGLEISAVSYQLSAISDS